MIRAFAILLTGLAGIGALTWLALGPLGWSGAIASDLETRVEAAIGQADRPMVEIRADPHRRAIHLIGDLPDEEAAELARTARAVPGVTDIVWETPPDTERRAAMRTCRVSLERAIASGTITFRPGSPYVNPEARRLLDRIAFAAGDCRDFGLAITGHSSRGGGEGAGLEMSAFRATAVRDALVERGIAAERLFTNGRGSEEPLPGDPADPANRRVELAIVEMPEGEQ